MARRTSKKKAASVSRSSYRSSRRAVAAPQANLWAVSAVLFVIFVLLLYILNMFSGGSTLPHVSSDTASQPVSKNGTLPALKTTE